jgi:hypothetical protein
MFQQKALRRKQSFSGNAAMKRGTSRYVACMIPEKWVPVFGKDHAE